MEKLSRTLSGMEDAITALERRGVNLRTHAERRNLETGRLPVFHVFYGNEEHWFTDRKELDEYLKDQEKQSGEELTVKTVDESDTTTESNGESKPILQIVEFHEVKTINAGLKSMDEMGFDVESLLPTDRTGLQRPRYVVKRGDAEVVLEDMRGLPGAIRAAGEKGMTVTRFKGLGEMNAEELRETTLDPDNRTLMQVRMTNAADADDMFRILMGDKVEPRREFIEKHALEVKNLDI